MQRRPPRLVPVSGLPHPEAPTSDDAPLVVVLAPRTDSADPSLDYYHDYSQSRQEFARAFATLGWAWRWQPVTTTSAPGVLSALARERHPQPLVVVNLCDGDETNDVPGLEVIHHLETLGLAHTGADAAFYRATSSKIGMKQAFETAGVATAPWVVIGHEPVDAAARPAARSRSSAA